MITVLLLIATAAGQDPVYVPAGTSVTAEVPSYLLPEPMLDECLIAKRKLSELIQPALESCQSVCSSALSTAQSGLTKCQTQLELDSTRIVDLLGSQASLETQLAKAKSQRNTAWAIAGSLVVGSLATAWVTSR